MRYLVLQVIRERFTRDSTAGVLLDRTTGEHIGYTLEDEVRPPSIKVKNETAIPDGTYEVVLSMSNRFKREMPEIRNVPGFQGIRIHGGNTHQNTSGCLLVAENRIRVDVIQGSLESNVVAMMKEYDRTFIEFTSLNQLDP